MTSNYTHSLLPRHFVQETVVQREIMCYSDLYDLAVNFVLTIYLNTNVHTLQQAGLVKKQKQAELETEQSSREGFVAFILLPGYKCSDYYFCIQQLQNNCSVIEGTFTCYNISFL